MELRVRSVSETPLSIEGILHAARSAEKNLGIFGGDLQTFKGQSAFFLEFSDPCVVSFALYFSIEIRGGVLAKSSDARKLPKYPEIDPRDPRKIV